jgi:DNA mismatch repair protein MutS2
MFRFCFFAYPIIGLPEDLIAEASDKAGKDYISMDKYLQDIVRDKRYWESKRQQIRQQEKHLEALAENYQANLAEIEAQRKDMAAQAKAGAERLLSEANALIERTIREIKEAQAEKEKTQAARQNLTHFKASLQSDAVLLPTPTAAPKAKKAKKPRPSATAAPPTDAPLAIGDAVRIRGQRPAGEVLALQGNKVVVAFGALKTTVALSRLEKVSKNQLRRDEARPVVLLSDGASDLPEKKLHFKLEIDVRGMRGDEAIRAVTFYIDDAIQCNAGRVRILHGTGTGALRQMIRAYLKTVSGVQAFRDEDVQLGGVGVTVVDLG